MLKALALTVAVMCCLVRPIAAAEDGMKERIDPGRHKVATFAGGCFWCVEADFEKLPGVVEVVSGYTGGNVPNPTYEQVSSGTTGHLESVQVWYDPAKVDYPALLDWFWRHIDPTDPDGSFVDRGRQYASAIFYGNEEEHRLAEESKRQLDASGRYTKPVVTDIRPLGPFYEAEEHHQDYYRKHKLKYSFYRYNSGRDQFLEKTWGKDGEKPAKAAAKEDKSMTTAPAGSSGEGRYRKPPESELKARLTPLQYKVTQEEGTEPAYKNEYWDNHRDGIYVDIVSGEPLFSSRDKYESGTGWPSFTRPLEPGNIVEREDRRLFSTRTEIRSRYGDSHLGHVFPDGPPPSGLRYCMNSAALRFIPKEDLEKEGYGQYGPLFQ